MMAWALAQPLQQNGVPANARTGAPQCAQALSARATGGAAKSATSLT
jgi:hypothetical protein